MATILEAYERWSSIDADEILDSAILENESEIIDAQVQQMREGFNSNGEIIGEYQNPEYAKAKKAMGSIAPYGIVDLRLTSSFQNQIKMQVTNDAIKLDSDDEKDVTLINWYGRKIFGLTPERLGEINQKSILPSYLKRLRENLGYT